ncbi:MAG: hypothetical protein ACE5DN_04830, partial [Flavobacteriales bacterium]
MKQLFTYLFPAMIALLLSFSYASGQTDYKSEDDLKKQADVLFEKDDFTAALPLFSQLLSLYPNDADYNFKYGACALMSKPDKTESLRYLEYAAGRPNTDPRVFFYLGKAYHLNFRFTEAIDNYRKFKERAKPKVSAKLNTDRHITMCENGRQLLRNLTDLIVTGKKTLGLDDFYKAYDLSDYGGKLIRKPDDFKTALDKKMNDNSVMYLDNSASVIYFSSYGEKGKNGRDIYMAKRLPNGDWSKPANMGAPINTPYDEDFPFLHPSGDVFYFASKGHNSMGGYDIFKSYYDAVSHTWGVPVNQDFAINTPSDDYLYVTNSDETNACFASGRATDPKHVTVYNIKVKRIPLSLKIIKGRFTAYNTKSAKITVKDEATGQIAGIFKTDKNDGAYLINVPGSGKYKFIVETDESPVAYVGMVEIPDLQDFKPLFQEMKLIAKNGQEQLNINNLFDQLPESDNIELLASEVYKEKSELEVNKDQYERRTVLDEDLVASSEGGSENTDVIKEDYGENTLEELKPEAMIVSAYKNAEALQQEADSLRKQSDLAFAVAANKKELASESADKAGQFISASMEISDESERQEMIREANQLKKQSVKNATQASAIYKLATKLDDQATERQNEAIASQKYAEEFESAVNEPSSSASIEKLNQLKKALEKQESSDAGIEPELKTAEQKSHVARENADKQLTYAFNLKNERKSLESHLNDLQNSLKESKKKKEKQDLEMQIDRVTQEL